MRKSFHQKILIAAAVLLVLGSGRAFAASCPGKAGGSGYAVDTGRPGLMITHDAFNNRIYFSDDFGTGRISELDGLIVSPIDYNSYPYDVKADDTTGIVYYALRNGNAIKAYNPATSSTVAAVAVGTNPYGLDISYATKRLYVANFQSNNVSVISLDPAVPGSYHKVIKTIAVGNGPWQVAVNESTGYVYVSNRTSRTISVIRESTLAVGGTVPLTFPPGELTVSTSTNKVYVLNANGTGTVTVINGNTLPGSVQTTFATGGSNIWDIDVNPNLNHIWMTDYTAGTVVMVTHDNPPDGTSYTVNFTISYSSPLRGIEVNPATDDYYVASEDGLLLAGTPGCDRSTFDMCMKLRFDNVVNDAAVDSFLSCYFHQM